MKRNIRGYKYYKNTYQLGTTIVGSPSISSGGEANNFTPSSYMRLPSAFNPENNDWEWVIAFKLTSSQTGGILVGTDKSRYHWDKYGNRAFWHYMGIEPTVTKEGITVILRNEHTYGWGGFTRTDEFYRATIKRTIQNDKLYLIRITKIGTTYTTELTDLNNSFIDTYSQVNAEIINGYNTLLGANLWVEGGTNTKFNGTIDLFRSYIKINGQIFWKNRIKEETSQIDYEANQDNPNYFQVIDTLTRNFLIGKKVYMNKKVIETPFTSPDKSQVLSTLGGASFGAMATYTSNGSAVGAFPTSDNLGWGGNISAGSKYYFYNPYPVKLTSLAFCGGGSSNDDYIKAFDLYGSNDNISYTKIGSYNRTATISNVVIPINCIREYKYYYIQPTDIQRRECIRNLVISVEPQNIIYTKISKEEYNNTPEDKRETEISFYIPYTKNGYYIVQRV